MGAARRSGIPLGIVGLSVTWTTGMILVGRGAVLDHGGLLAAGIVLAALAFLGSGAGIALLWRRREKQVQAIRDTQRAELRCVTSAVAALGERAGVEPQRLAVVIPLHHDRAS